MKIKNDKSFKDLTSMRIGGVVKHYCEVKTKDELEKALEFAHKRHLPITVIGEGSNSLARDTEYPGLVIKLKNSNVHEEREDNTIFVTVGAGKNWDEFVRGMVEKNYQGVECLSFIPGTVGAAPVQNIGAYGQELSESFVELEAYDRNENRFVTIDKSECKFGYRESIFKSPGNQGRYIIFSVKFRLVEDGDPKVEYKSLKEYLAENKIIDPSISDVRDAVVAIRKSKLEDPTKTPNTGSFFKNPIVTKDVIDQIRGVYDDVPCFEQGSMYKIPAGWLIDKCGWKGNSLGSVKVSDKHALVITNPDGKGSADDIFALAKKIRDDVKNKFGIDLEIEPVIIN